MKKLALSFAALTVLSGCAYVTPVSNTTDLSKVDFSNSYEFKQGADCSYSLLGLLPVTPGARFIEAVQDANLTKVNFVESGYEYYLLFGRHCIRVYGE